MDIVYSNIHANHDSQMIRIGSDGPVDQEILRLARYIESDCFTSLVSVSASQHSFVAVELTALSQEELKGKGFLRQDEPKREEVEGSVTA